MKASKQFIAAFAFAVVSAAGIGSVSAADLGYEQYQHNLDAVNPVTEQNVDQDQVTVTTDSGVEGYNRYLHINGWTDNSASEQSVKTVASSGYSAYLHNLGWN
jgi:hypothetical protein